MITHDRQKLTTDMFNPSLLSYAWFYDPTVNDNLYAAPSIESSSLFQEKRLNIELIGLRLKTRKELYVMTLPEYNNTLDKNGYLYHSMLQDILNGHDKPVFILRERKENELRYINYIITDNEEILFQIKLSL